MLTRAMPRATPAASLALALLAAACSAPRPPVTTAFDGTYQGQGFTETNPGGFCAQTMQPNPMTVTNGRVVFGRFNGFVAPDGSVQMVLGGRTGGSFVSGQFQKGRFLGRLRNPQPSCIVRLEMNRV